MATHSTPLQDFREFREGLESDSRRSRRQISSQLSSLQWTGFHWRILKAQRLKPVQTYRMAGQCSVSGRPAKKVPAKPQAQGSEDFYGKVVVPKACRIPERAR